MCPSPAAAMLALQPHSPAGSRAGDGTALLTRGKASSPGHPLTPCSGLGPHLGFLGCQPCVSAFGTGLLQSGLLPPRQRFSGCSVGHHGPSLRPLSPFVMEALLRETCHCRCCCRHSGHRSPVSLRTLTCSSGPRAAFCQGPLVLNSSPPSASHAAKQWLVKKDRGIFFPSGMSQ